MKGITRLAQAIKKRGGRAMLIGGAVIDSIQNRPIKDFDIEVYGLSMSDIEALLTGMGLPVDTVGKAFGIIKTRVDGIEIDLSVPRRENRIGVGHTGFEVEIDHTMTPREAGMRRDLTINSMYKDMLTGEVVDPFGGLADLRDGIIRATNPRTFIEDPLRVLRIMQLLPRKGKTVHADTIALCRTMVGEFVHLPKERVFAEFEKLLLKAEKPSMGLQFLRASGWLVHFPELANLIGCKQNPEWHPEGDVWVHTCMVLDNAAQLRHLLPEDLRLTYMFGALLHDVGKPGTTDAQLRSPGHDTFGAPIAANFMRRITNSPALIEGVAKLTELHMRPGQLTQAAAGDSAWRRLHNAYRLDVLGYLCKADSAGRTGRSIADAHAPSANCFAYFEQYGAAPIPPLVLGRDLIEMGLKPSALFGQILAEAYNMQLDGQDRLALLEYIKQTYTKG